MRLNILSIQRVAEAGLCSGCGVCASAAPQSIRMVDTLDQGRRPLVRSDADPAALRDALAVCPGLGLAHPPGHRPSAWGPVLEVWEGHAADPDVRFRASSGGIASALAIYCLESLSMHAVLHTAARTDAPHLNHSVLSTTRQQILANAGSRYAPASPADSLRRIEHAPGPCVFIGKPCDVAGATRLARLRPQLAQRLALTIAFFCAGTPTTRGTLEMLAAMGVSDPADLASLRYRGHGWPGRATATRRDGRPATTLSYEQSWDALLTRHKLWRCNLCADHTGEFADLAVADAWHRRREGDPGRSLVVVRSERARRLLHAAIAQGAVVLEPSNLDALRASQPGLLRTRASVWGRATALRAIGLPAPTYRRMATASTWRRELSHADKLRSFLGTWRRALARRLWRPLPTIPLAHDALVETKPTPAPRAPSTPRQGAHA